MFKLRETLEKSPDMMRDVYCNTLMELAETDPRICALDADLVSSSGMKPFFRAYPDRAINCGVQEANMIGVAAGLSATGKIPFAHSFGIFATRRACDQIFMSAAYAKLNVRIVGSDPGVTAAYNGGTHMPFEDMGVLRSIPQITLLEPTDPVMLEELVRKLTEVYGVYYIRMARKNVAGIYEKGSSFTIGRGNLLKDGSDVTLIASGIMVAEALKAREVLASEGISAKVVDMFTWKPVDSELIARCAAETGAFVTAENHNTVGGLGSAVTEAVCATCPVPVEMVGTHDRFGQVGTEDFLREEYKLTAGEIAAAARRVLARKAK
ncbi:transketolase family protein [Papillibacter cinnamivorans]|uniref:Transketolase n=1 Tax=Papillibacter cinnamivorans DSM 12816 TaxID=1122930 RepID=A0A1W2AAL2_9FIRM|nr:transketolase C-terminal domain-containing protein [Papillibacter cinnamivorans]SMC57660.1 transketolase [Papillibacter cinnamivorans DSM 12816]